MEHRQQAYSQSRSNSNLENEFDMPDRRGRSSTLFSRTESEIVSFDDFVIRQIIGKGTFGKVITI
jgi:hypothetical protein